MSAGTVLARTIEEIKARIAEVEAGDFFGAEIQELICSLPFADAQAWLKSDATPADWTPALTAQKVHARAVAYLPFAMGKATDHRGLSASRSIDHYRGWMWLLGKDSEIDWEDYAQYGAPILRQVAELLGAATVWQEGTSTGLDRMADGLECRPDGCNEGCGEL